MTDLFHIWLRGTSSTAFDVSAETGGVVSADEQVIYTQSEVFSDAKERLLERRPGLGLRSPAEQETVCAVIGQELFNAFFVGSVLTLYRKYRDENDSPRIALHMSRGLYGMPWELLCDPKDALRGVFLSLIGSIIRYDCNSTDTDPVVTFFPPSSTLKFVFVSPRPIPTPEEEAVSPIEVESSGNISFEKVSSGSYSEFLGLANNDSLHPDGFIFYGHGDALSNIGHLIFVEMQGMWVKRPVRDPRAAASVSGPLALKRSLRVSCLMACESAWINEEMLFENTVTGSLLTKTRVGFVIGAQLKIDFAAAASFLRELLSSIQSGVALDLAVKQGRQAVKGLFSNAGVSPRSPLDWWVPVLYAKSTNFDLSAQPRITLPTLTQDI